ncbi:MAG: 1-deoxy-D-xylulose-5-phosphate reductoisomerase [Pigmentiphaga sp.]|nr:1-deoxy-D-xylulose-5-phosphate reductoisomerase [Pigmentiphaga sp.]
MKRTVTVLGSTGSIGRSTLDVILRHPDRYAVHGLSAHSRMEALAEQAAASQARVVHVPDEAAADCFKRAWVYSQPCPQIWVGSERLCELARDPASDSVMAAIVGAAGLPSALAAAQAGKRVLLANKEALVVAGRLFMDAVHESGAELLPIDSEHNAIFQCLPQRSDKARPPRSAQVGVEKLILTASGGPFRTVALDALAQVTPEQACKHPNWSMGKKISVDSATMLNKGLEVIEAHWLFSMPASRIKVVIHPQSVVHSMVEYTDGSVLAQLGQPDMRTPIAYGLAYPERVEAGVSPLDLIAHGRLDFEAPDLARFPCLGLAFKALELGQGACVSLNAANEVAVAAFLSRRCAYLDIPRIIDAVLTAFSQQKAGLALSDLDALLALDAWARACAEQWVAACPS